MLRSTFPSVQWRTWTVRVERSWIVATYCQTLRHLSWCVGNQFGCTVFATLRKKIRCHRPVHLWWWFCLVGHMSVSTPICFGLNQKLQQKKTAHGWHVTDSVQHWVGLQNVDPFCFSVLVSGFYQIPTWFTRASEKEMTTYISSRRTSCNCIERLNLTRLSTILTRDGRLWWPINTSWRRIDPDYYPKSDSISKHDDKLQSCHVKRSIISFSIKTDLIKIYSISLIRPKIDWSPHDWQSTKIKLFFQYSISLQESRRQKKWQVLWTHRQEDQRIKSYRNC